MKTKFWFFALLLLGGFIFSSCDDDTDLLKGLAEGKMVIKISGNEKFAQSNMEDCKWMNYGDAMKGEVFIEAHLNGESTEPFFMIMYGDYSNQVPFTVKSYSTGVTADKMHVSGSFGNADEDAEVVVDIVEITATAIKGTFKGKLKEEAGTIVDVEGAFWAKKFETMQ
jgi:hypothetical protein